jgi:hypothetical protein
MDTLSFVQSPARAAYLLTLRRRTMKASDGFFLRVL